LGIVDANREFRFATECDAEEKQEGNYNARADSPPVAAGRAKGATKKEGPLRSPLNKERNGPAIGFKFSGLV
jgi:hypothetical protein